MSRPLTSTDKREENLSKTFYRDQINKVARAIKELIVGIQHAKDFPKEEAIQKSSASKASKKNITLVAVIIAMLGVFSFGYYYFGGFGSRIEHSPDKSIAVLPFVDMSPNKDQEYFSDGMTDEILNRLLKLGDLKVISRTSSMKFRGAKLTAKEIAFQLGVANILEGSLQKAGNRIKITVQLIDAATDNHLWSETYERDLNDVFAIRDCAVSGERAAGEIDPFYPEQPGRNTYPKSVSL